MTARKVEAALRALASPEKAVSFLRFFKNGPGEYGEGDQFIGVIMPDQRKIAKEFKDLPDAEIATLIRHKIHECRLTGLVILVNRFKKKTADHTALVDVYLGNLEGVNSWDLVDTSCHHILGPWFENRDRQLLHDFSNSGDLWKQRIAMVTCFHFIRRCDFEDAFEIADNLIGHEHDLIHKAVGWMLREIGNRDIAVEEDFLKPRYSTMPRTMLRYAIEKFPEPKRKAYLAGTIE